MVGLVMHGLLFKDTHFVANDSPKLNYAINTYLISLNINLYLSIFKITPVSILP